MALTVLLGGARSGKSALAARLAGDWAGPVTVVVTGQAGDAEMAERIERHRAGRPRSWRTVEAPRELEPALRAAPDGGFVIVDCLTLWVSNLMAQGLADGQVERRARAAAAVAAARSGPTVVVSNEVGAGIVPAGALARRYRDLLGQVNASWAAAADQALLLVAGRAVPLLDPLAVLGTAGGAAGITAAGWAPDG
ncbi:MAG TPA: bifunctional adenosylcobinamide kinase/adenosylcobinamide-phosphate guanylyltransferase [Actinomycetes bacterium]|jgi:adenosyl cobinamide kinase/adenosyl cobinamide phosphate guanylyltransferase|nr:bifunctional adenosylcobinamide kinase/adenosylcobinamide-phosphate guanylyltransferase [Actinomycetes bacterium]